MPNDFLKADSCINTKSKFERDATSKLYGKIYSGNQDYSSVGQNP